MNTNHETPDFLDQISNNVDELYNVDEDQDDSSESLLDEEKGGLDDGEDDHAVVIKRQIYFRRASLSNGSVTVPKPHHHLTKCCRNMSQKLCASDCLKTKFHKMFPFIRIMKNYNVKSDLPTDIVAGLTVGIMHIPQGLAYGMLANLLPIHGLYVSFFPALIYFFFGTSRHLSLGTFAVVCVMVGGIVSKSGCGSSVDDYRAATAMTSLTSTGEDVYTSTATDNSLYYNITSSSGTSDASDDVMACNLAYATAAAMLIGIYQVVMGFFGLGFITVYMPEPLTRGFTTGAALHVFTNQMKQVFGIKLISVSGNFKIARIFYVLCSKIKTLNLAALATFVLCGVILYVWKRFFSDRVRKRLRVPFPMELLIIIVATVISYFGDLNSRLALPVVGFIPSGIPLPRVPPIHRFLDVAFDAFSVAFVIFAIGVSLGRTFASKHNYTIDPNQELFAYGITNFISSFFNCFPASAALARSSVLEGVGCRTQIACVTASMFLLGVLFGVGPLFQKLPTSVLAAIIIVNLEGMLRQLSDLPILWKRNTYDFLIWLVVFLSVVILDVDTGLVVGIFFSLFTVVLRDQNSKTILLGNVPNSEIYSALIRQGATNEHPRIKVFRFESSLYFANAEHFAKRMFDMTGVSSLKRLKAKAAKKAKRTEQENDQIVSEKLPANLHFVILDCSGINYVDTTGVATLRRVIKNCKDIDVTVLLAVCNDSLLNTLERCEFFKTFDYCDVFYTVHDAMLAALQKETDLVKSAKEKPAAITPEWTNNTISLVHEDIKVTSETATT